MLFFFSFFLAKKNVVLLWLAQWLALGQCSIFDLGRLNFLRPPYIHRLRKLIHHFARLLFVDCLSKLNSISSPPFLSFFNATTENRVTVAATSRRTFFQKKKNFFQGNAILNHTHTILDVDGPCVDSATTNEKKEPLESKQMFPDRNLRPNRVKRVLERFW